MRKIPALLVAVGMLATLTACAGAPGSDDCGNFRSGDASAVIEAPGEFGMDPQVDFPTPIVTDTTQVTTLIAGTGDVLQAGQPIRAELSIFNGETGEKIQSTQLDGNGMLTMVGEATLPPVGSALECQRVGSRIAVAASAQDAHDAAEIAEIDVAAGDTFVFVVDVLESYLAKADGAPQLPQAGDPAVVVAPNGAPGITIPKSGNKTAPPPDELVVSPLRVGDGAPLKDGDTAVMHYTGVLWDTNKVFDSSWEKDSAAVFQLAEGSVIDGFHEALVGQTIGSQVLIVVPPELGYGDAGSGAVPAGATLVFVVDILGLIE